MVPEYSRGHEVRSHQRSLAENDQENHGKRVSSLDRATSGGGVRSPSHASLSHGTTGVTRSLSAERAGGNYHDSKLRGVAGNHFSGVHVKSSPTSSVGDYSPTGKITPQGWKLKQLI